MNVVDHSDGASVGHGITAGPTRPILLFLLFCLACGAGGCVEPYAARPTYRGTYSTGYPGYGPRPGYGNAGYGYPGYGNPGYGYPGYGNPGYGYPTSVSVEIGDRPYYTRGPGYQVGRAYYVWRPGHWSRRHVWIHGHYVLRG